MTPCKRMKMSHGLHITLVFRQTDAISESSIRLSSWSCTHDRRVKFCMQLNNKYSGTGQRLMVNITFFWCSVAFTETWQLSRCLVTYWKRVGVLVHLYMLKFLLQGQQISFRKSPIWHKPALTKWQLAAYIFSCKRLALRTAMTCVKEMIRCHVLIPMCMISQKKVCFEEDNT